MKKFVLLLAFAALSATCSFAQNANSGVTVSKDGGEWIIIDDCGVRYAAISSNYVTMENGFIKFTGIFDLSESCEQYDKATIFSGPTFHIVVTPTGLATLQVIINPRKP